MDVRQQQIISGFYILPMDRIVNLKLRHCYLDEIKAEIQAVERMLKALIKSLENKPLNP